MLRDLTSPQLTELEAFWRIEGGWGESKEDYRNAQLLSMQANLNRNKKQRLKPYKPDDFVMRPKFSKSDPEQDKEKEVRAQLDAMSSGGEKKKRKSK